MRSCTSASFCANSSKRRFDTMDSCTSQRTPTLLPVGKLLITCLLLASVGAACGGPEAQDHWPQWRGPLGTGVAPSAQPPVEWSETRHVRWKTPLPGKG